MHLSEARLLYCLLAQSWNSFFVQFLLVRQQLVEEKYDCVNGDSLILHFSVYEVLLCWNKGVNLTGSLFYYIKMKLIFRQPSMYIPNVFHFNVQWEKVLLGCKLMQELASASFSAQQWCSWHIARYLILSYISYHFGIDLASSLNSKRW